jgi:hypothetical protein
MNLITTTIVTVIRRQRSHGVSADKPEIDFV